jgi:hypothetical protein
MGTDAAALTPEKIRLIIPFRILYDAGLWAKAIAPAAFNAFFLVPCRALGTPVPGLIFGCISGLCDNTPGF